MLQNMKKAQRKNVILRIVILREGETGQLLLLSREECIRENFNSIDGNLKVN